MDFKQEIKFLLLIFPHVHKKQWRGAWGSEYRSPRKSVCNSCDKGAVTWWVGQWAAVISQIKMAGEVTWRVSLDGRGRAGVNCLLFFCSQSLCLCLSRRAVFKFHRCCLMMFDGRWLVEFMISLPITRMLDEELLKRDILLSWKTSSFGDWTQATRR